MFGRNNRGGEQSGFPAAITEGYRGGCRIGVGARLVFLIGAFRPISCLWLTPSETRLVIASPVELSRELSILGYCDEIGTVQPADYQQVMNPSRA
jgi:hypothetical protein